MYMRGVWRPLTVAVVVGSGVLLPQSVATAAPSATNPVPCTAIDHHLVGTSGDVLGQLLNGQGCSITEQDGQGRVSVAQTSPPTGSRLSPAGFQSAAVASVAADADTRSEKAPTDASPDTGSASGDSAEHGSGKPRDDESNSAGSSGNSSGGSTSDGSSAGSSSSGPSADGSSQPSQSSTSSAGGSIAGASPSGPVTLSGGAMQWRGDFDTRNTSQWELETARSYSLQVLDGGAGHTTAGRFEVRDGDTPVDSGERSEAKAPDWTDVSDGDERWYSFSMMFDRSFPVPADGWCDPMQWHTANADHSAADGSPALNLQCGPDDKLYLQVGDKDMMPIGMLDRGVWHDYLLHVKFSNNPAVAFEEVHRDGQLVLPKTSPRYANMTTPKAYLKIGMYRKGTNNGPMVVWHDGMAVYTSAPTMSAATGPAVTSTMQILPAGQPDDVMLTGIVN